MIFKYENLSHKFILDFTNQVNGPHLVITSYNKDLTYGTSWVCAGFKIRDNQISWNETDGRILNLTSDAINYIERIWRLKAFW